MLIPASEHYTVEYLHVQGIIFILEYTKRENQLHRAGKVNNKALLLLATRPSIEHESEVLEGKQGRTGSEVYRLGDTYRFCPGYNVGRQEKLNREGRRKIGSHSSSYPFHLISHDRTSE